MFHTIIRTGRSTSLSAIASVIVMSAPMWAQPAFVPGEGFRPARFTHSKAAPSIVTGPREAVISTTISVTNATGSIGASGISLSGNASLTTIGSGSFTGSMSLTPSASGNITGTFTITLTGSGDKINGTLSVPASALAGGSINGSATITGGTGAYAGATGSFPNITGTLVVGLSTTLTFTGAGSITTGGSGGPTGGGGPVITDVLDAASNTSNIAQGSIFIVKGTGLSAAGYTALGFPLPTTSGGVSIKFAPLGTGSSGNGTSAFLVYLYNQGGVNQLAAVAPSTLAVGTYDVSVTYNGATGVIPGGVKVVKSKPALLSADSTGTGLAVVQNYISAAQLDIDRLSTFSSSGYTFSPSRPGQVLIAWATGLGPITTADNTAAPVFDFSTNGSAVQVIVGGRTITPLYAGRAPGLAGADQINFILPADITTGCTVSFQISVNGLLSNPTFIAIAPDANSATCVQPGFTSAQLQQYDNGATYTVGGFSLTQFSQNSPQGNFKIDAASGQFTRYTGFQLAGLSQARSLINPNNACYVTHQTTTGQSTGGIAVTTIGLDAGNVTLSGPASTGLSNSPFTQDPKTNGYNLSLGFEGLAIPGQKAITLAAGTYTVSGTGGKDVGRFTATANFGAPLNITGGLPATVNRGAGLPLSWTGGNSSDLVEIYGGTSTVTGTGATAINDSWLFICTTTAGAGGFTVPPSILTQIPAAQLGFLFVASGSVSTFTAPLTAGGNVDAAAFSSLSGSGSTPAYQ